MLFILVSDLVLLGAQGSLILGGLTLAILALTFVFGSTARVVNRGHIAVVNLLFRLFDGNSVVFYYVLIMPLGSSQTLLVRVGYMIVMLIGHLDESFRLGRVSAGALPLALPSVSLDLYTGPQ